MPAARRSNETRRASPPAKRDERCQGRRNITYAGINKLLGFATFDHGRDAHATFHGHNATGSRFAPYRSAVQERLDLALIDVHYVPNIADLCRLSRQGGEVIPRYVFQRKLPAAGHELSQALVETFVVGV